MEVVTFEDVMRRLRQDVTEQEDNNAFQYIMGDLLHRDSTTWSGRWNDNIKQKLIKARCRVTDIETGHVITRNLWRY